MEVYIYIDCSADMNISLQQSLSFTPSSKFQIGAYKNIFTVSGTNSRILYCFANLFEFKFQQLL